MRSLPAVAFVAAAALAPLVWGACTEPPPPASPSGAPAGADSAAGSAGADLSNAPPATAAVPSVQPTQTIMTGPTQTATAGSAQAQSAVAAPASNAELDRLIAALPKKGSVQSAAQCQALIPRANDAMRAARAGVTACASDADCEIIPDSICVQASCGMSVARAARPAYEAARKRVTDAACGAWDAGGCTAKVPLPTPSCAMPIPVCKGGQCSSRW